MDQKLASAVDRLLRRALKEHWSPAAAFREIVDVARSKQKSAAWKKVAKVSIDRDLETLTRQITEVFTKEPPPRNINGLWFGLFEDVDSGWTLYVAGARDYRKMGGIEWAVQPEWWPKRRYMKSDVLKQLTNARPQKDFDTAWLIEMCVIFPFVVIAVAEAIRRTDPAILLGPAPKRAIACGFDAGDCFNIGELAEQGLRIYDK